jgi:hypothetical protein
MAKFIVNSFSFPVNSGGDKFPDIDESHSLFIYVQTLKNLDIVSGFSDQTYKPDNPVKRGEVTKFIVVSLQIIGFDTTPTTPHSFPDVPSGYTHEDYISYLNNIEVGGEKIISGFSDGTYRPEDSLDRGQMAKIIWNTILHANLN